MGCALLHEYALRAVNHRNCRYFACRTHPPTHDDEDDGTRIHFMSLVTSLEIFDVVTFS